MHYIGIIDDEKTWINEFKRKYDKHFKILHIALLKNINLLVESIINSGVESIVVDYQLAETRKDIQYTGIDLLNKLHETKFEFPGVILTAFQEEAETKADNPYIIYEKNFVYSYEKETTSFARKLNLFIEDYSKKIETMSTEIKQLLDKKNSKKNLSIKDEEKLIELDDLLEKYINKKNKIPLSLKRTSAEKN